MVPISLALSSADYVDVVETSGPTRQWPLVGRERTRATVLAALTGASGRLVHVEAAAGSGKTYLLDHVAADIEADVAIDRLDRITLTGGTVAPFSLAFELLGMAPSDLGLAPEGPRSFLEAGVGNVTDALAVELLIARAEALADAQRVVWMIDDIHLADGGSMLWLTALARLDPIPVRVISAGRPAAVGSALHDFLTHEQSVITRVELDSLADDDVAVLCRSRFGVGPGANLTALLAAAGGSPLVVTALLEALAPEDVAVGDTADIAGDVAARMVSEVPTAVGDRVRSVAGPDRLVIAAMALAGSSFAPSDVAQVLGVGLVDVLGVVDRLVTGGLLVARDVYRFRHEHYRLAAAELLDTPSRRSLHANYGRLLMDRGEHPLRVVDHLINAGTQGSQAADWLVRAATALVQFDSGGALDLIERATAMTPEPNRVTSMTKARALANVGRATESEAIARHLLRDATIEEEIQLRRDLAMVKFQQALPLETAAELRRAAELAPDEYRRARMSAESSFGYLLAADFATAGRVARAGSLDGDRLGDVVTVIAAEMVGCLVALYQHDLDEAERLAERLESLSDLAEAIDAALYQPWFSASLVRTLMGNFDHARRLNGIGRARSQRAGYLWMVPAYDALDALGALIRGELDDVEAAATAALASGIEDSFGAALWCRAFLARVAVVRGDRDRTREHITAALALMLPGQAQLGWDHLAIARAQLAELDGDLISGSAELLEIWEAFEAFGIDSPRQELAFTITRLAVRSGQADVAQRMVAATSTAAAVTGHRLWRLDADEVTALVAGDAVALAQLADENDTAGRSLRALELRVEAVRRGSAGGPAAMAASIRELSARLDVEVGAVGALGLLERLGGAAAVVTPGVRRGTGRLSKSERQVVERVAQGLTNSQIAEQLFVSRRTVESHVSSAYRKLGATNRVELARVLLDPGTAS